MKPSGAKYFKCALQVNSYRYYHDFRNGTLFDESFYNKEVLNFCLKEGIEVIGLAEHGDISLTENLRNLLSENSITVFPGFE